MTFSSNCLANNSGKLETYLLITITIGCHRSFDRIALNESTGPTMSELLVDPATSLHDHNSSHRPTSWPMRNIHGVGYGAGGYPRVPTFWISQSIDKGYPSSRFPNLYGIGTHMGIINPPGFTPWNVHSTCTSRSPDQHRPPPQQWPWLVTQAYQFLPHFGLLSLPRTIRHQPHPGENKALN